MLWPLGMLFVVLWLRMYNRTNIMTWKQCMLYLQLATCKTQVPPPSPTKIDPSLNYWCSTTQRQQKSKATTTHSFYNKQTTIMEWDTSSVTTMHDMFFGATSVNQDISMWDTLNVTDMGHMFGCATSFKQNLSGWDVSMVTNMAGMFWNATLFHPDTAPWGDERDWDSAAWEQNNQRDTAHDY
jgi:surface protein